MHTARQLAHIAKSLGQDTIKEVLEKLYQKESKSLEECCEITGLGIHTLRSLMKSLGISTRQGPQKKLDITLTDLRKNTLGQIALRHGVSRATIWRLKQKLKAEAARALKS